MIQYAKNFLRLRPISNGMKIIYLANARIPTERAHGLQIMKMCQAFTRQGVEVRLIVARRHNPQFRNVDPFAYYGIKERFTLVRLPLLDLIALRLPLKGLRVLIQNSSFGIAAFFYLLFQKTDYIYSRDQFALLPLALFKKNLVLELHTFPNKGLKIYKWLFNRLKKIVVISRGIAEELKKIGVSEDKILVAPDGVDLADFNIDDDKTKWRQKLNLNQNKKIVVYAGHLYDWKGVYTLIDAAKYLPLDYLVVLVGGMKNDIDVLNKYIKDKEIFNAILVGHKSPAEVPGYLKAADCLVLPNSAKKTISREFTSPLKLFEYMASGRPIVASHLPSINEVLNENNSILVEPDDAVALSRGIARVLADQELSTSLVQVGLQLVQKYSWENRVKLIISSIF